MGLAVLHCYWLQFVGSLQYIHQVYLLVGASCLSLAHLFQSLVALLFWTRMLTGCHSVVCIFYFKNTQTSIACYFVKVERSLLQTEPGRQHPCHHKVNNRTTPEYLIQLHPASSIVMQAAGSHTRVQCHRPLLQWITSYEWLPVHVFLHFSCNLVLPGLIVMFEFPPGFTAEY